ncbi:MAG TPA: Mpo1-like protein, partial [Aquabacterium sp.]|nr:Mpo1-like protein [Aquabacterium sp.]
MKSLTEQLAQYASYHRDQRNVWTHFIGIPMIVLSVATLLSRWSLGAVPIGSAGLELTVAVLVSAMMAVYYLRLDLRYGLVMSGLLALACTE